MTPDVRSLPVFSVSTGRLGAIRLDMGAGLAVMALAGLVLVPPVGKAAVLLFLTAGLILILRRPSAAIGAALKHWPLTTVVTFCILSLIWSREPMLSLRHGLQLAATLAVVIAVTDRLTPTAFCRALAILLGLGMLASILLGDTSGESAAWTGIYGSKNAFAGAAATFVIFAAGLALTTSSAPLVRVAATVATAIGIALVLLAQSVGALVLLIVTLLGTAFLLALSRFGRTGGVAILTAGTLGLLLALLIASAHIPALSEYLLNTTGKDLTLTGRTELWAVASALIQERPVLGVGFQAFWVHGNAEAEALWLLFGIESRSGFNFHNMYLSNAVEIGLAGVALQCLVLFGTAWLTCLWTLRSGGAIPAIFFALTLTVVLGSLIEVPLFTQFGLKTALIFAAFIYAGKAIGRRA